MKSVANAFRRLPQKPVAPPVNRAQPVPKVLQTKRSLAGNPDTGQTTRAPVGPPQPVPKVLQAKRSLPHSTPGGQAPRQPIAAPVYRPEAKKIVPAKPSCYLCAAIAGFFGVSIESKDKSKYPNYVLPKYLRLYPQLFQSFVGEHAYASFLSLPESEQHKLLADFGAIKDYLP